MMSKLMRGGDALIDFQFLFHRHIDVDALHRSSMLLASYRRWSRFRNIAQYAFASVDACATADEA